MLKCHDVTEISIERGIQHLINDREHRRGNQKWTIQRNREHRVHKMKTNKTKTQQYMCCTSLYVNKYI
jgi:hypothetical protein